MEQAGDLPAPPDRSSALVPAPAGVPVIQSGPAAPAAPSSTPTMAGDGSAAPPRRLRPQERRSGRPATPPRRRRSGRRRMHRRVLLRPPCLLILLRRPLPLLRPLLLPLRRPLPLPCPRCSMECPKGIHCSRIVQGKTKEERWKARQVIWFAPLLDIAPT